MRAHRWVPIAVSLVMGVSVTVAAGVRLAESTSEVGSSATGNYKRLLVIGITDDTEARRRFEDKFVSHRRGRGIKGVTSYSIVEDLTVPSEDREGVILKLVDQEVDGVITIRPVALADQTEEEWVAAWRKSWEQLISVRELIDASLPFAGVKAKKYGVEIALWDMVTRYHVWGARTDAHSLRKLRKNAGDLLQQVIRELAQIGLV